MTEMVDEDLGTSTSKRPCLLPREAKPKLWLLKSPTERPWIKKNEKLEVTIKLEARTFPVAVTARGGRTAASLKIVPQSHRHCAGLKNKVVQILWICGPRPPTISRTTFSLVTHGGDLQKH